MSFKKEISILRLIVKELQSHCKTAYRSQGCEIKYGFGLMLGDGNSVYFVHKFYFI